MSYSDHLRSSPPSISNAVEVFTQPVHAAAQSGNSENFESSLWKAWKGFFDLVGDTPHTSQDPVVEFIKILRRNEIPKNNNGQSFDIWGEEFNWNKLPILGPQAREIWDIEPEASSSSKEKEQWINRNAFLARITAISEPGDPLDFSLYGVWALRSAFESEEDIAAGFLLQVAGVWLLYAGETLQKRSVEKQVFDGRIAREGDALNGKDWKGFNEERWKFWVEALRQIPSKVDEAATKDLLTNALKKIENR